MSRLAPVPPDYQVSTIMSQMSSYGVHICSSGTTQQRNLVPGPIVEFHWRIEPWQPPTAPTALAFGRPDDKPNGSSELCPRPYVSYVHSQLSSSSPPPFLLAKHVICSTGLHTLSPSLSLSHSPTQEQGPSPLLSSPLPSPLLCAHDVRHYVCSVFKDMPDIWRSGWCAAYTYWLVSIVRPRGPSASCFRPWPVKMTISAASFELCIKVCSLTRPPLPGLLLPTVRPSRWLPARLQSHGTAHAFFFLSFARALPERGTYRQEGN